MRGTRVPSTAGRSAFAGSGTRTQADNGIPSNSPGRSVSTIHSSRGKRAASARTRPSP